MWCPWNLGIYRCIHVEGKVTYLLNWITVYRPGSLRYCFLSVDGEN